MHWDESRTKERSFYEKYSIAAHEKELFDDWYFANASDSEKNPIESREYSLMLKAWQARASLSR